MRQVLKFAAGIAAALVAFAGFAGVAAAQDGYEPPPPGVFDATYPTQVTAGGVLTLTDGVCPAANAEVTAALGDVALGGTLMTDEDGNFEGSFSVPADLAPGSYELVATCGGVEYTATDLVQVLAAGATPNNGTSNINSNGGGTNTGSTPLARTGFEARPLVTLGAAALVLGGAAVYGSRRRRTSLV